MIAFGKNKLLKNVDCQVTTDMSKTSFCCSCIQSESMQVFHFWKAVHFGYDVRAPLWNSSFRCLCFE